jgi:hypothetical protein
MAVMAKGVIRDAGKVDIERSRLLHFAKSLKLDDEIVSEPERMTKRMLARAARSSTYGRPPLSLASSSVGSNSTATHRAL